MSEQTSIVSGLANGQELAASDRTVMLPGANSTEFESVVLDKDGRAYLVTALVSARLLTDSMTVVAQEAAMSDESPVLAVRSRQTMGQLIINPLVPPLGNGKQLQELGATALAKNPSE